MPERRTIEGVIRMHAADHPDSPAILAPGRAPLSYAALASFIGETRERLNAWGIGLGDRLALAIAPRPEMAVAYLAASNAATCVPINPGATAAEIEDTLVTLKASAIVLSDGLTGHARDCASRLGIPVLTLFPRHGAAAGLFTLSGGMPGQAVRPGTAAPEDLALAIRTSGTTSKPKVVPVSHSLAVARGRIEAAAFDLDRDDRCLNFRPLHLHSAINAGLVVPLSAGGAVILPACFDAGVFFDQLRDFRATWFLGSPAYHDAILEQLRQDPESLRPHALRFVRSSSYRLAPEAMATLEATFGVPFLERLGGTESGLIARNPPPPSVRKPGTVGVPVDSEVALLDDRGTILGRDVAGAMGEIVVRGEGVFGGYEDNPEADEAAFVDGWFRTGDLGKWDSDGYLTVYGRVKEVINRGGQKISPVEVEDELLRHPRIAEVACFAVPHPTLGEDIAAAVVAADPADATIDEAAVTRFLRARLAAFKIPKRVVRCAALPRGPTGKLNRRGLAATLGIGSMMDDSGADRVGPAALGGRWESEIAAIWREILKRTHVGSRENFFALGGESLMAARLLARIGKVTGIDLPLECVFGEGGTVEGLSRLVDAAENGMDVAAPSSAVAPITRRNPAAPTPLSFSQERLRFLSELDPNDHVYNMQGAVRLHGPLQPDVLRRALNAIVSRHEILRARFPIVDGELQQVIAPELALEMPVLDLTAMPAPLREDAVRRIARDDARRPYDLSFGPLIGARLVRCADDEHVLLLPKHHLVFDGQSGGILYREIASLYGAFARGDPSPLPELPVQFGDYAAWQRQRLSGTRLEEELSYWLDHLKGAPPLLDLPTDRPRPDTQSYQGGRCWFSLSRELTAAIEAFSRRLGVTPFISLLAGFQLLLHRYSGQSDFVIGTVVGGRTRPEVEELLGLFVNTLPLRARFDGISTVADHVATVRQAAVGAYAHQEMPFDRLVAALNPDRSASYAPVVQVLFGLMPKDLRRVRIGDLVFERMNVDLGTARFDLSVMIGEDHGELEGFFEYSADLFDRTTVERMIGHFETLLRSMVASADAPIGAVELLSASERSRLVVEWNDTAVDFPRDRCIHQLFEERAMLTPDAIALVCGDRSLGYAELNVRANQLAHHLIGLGLQPEDRVGVFLERSFDLVVCFVAVMKAGGTYVPMDPAFPRERLAFMFQDSQTALVVTRDAFAKQLPPHAGRAVYLDRDRAVIAAQPPTNPSVLATGDSPAYVVYTSGSTGRPKGVVVSHRGVVRLLTGVDYARLDESRTLLMHSPISFDASTFELWGALLHGGRCVVVPQPVPTIATLGDALQRHRVTTLWLTASLFNLIVDEAVEILRGVEECLVGGEALSPSHVRAAQRELPGVQLINGYGPTESTTFATCYRIPALQDGGRPSIPIGVPIANTTIYVLDRHHNPVPIGVPGELWIGGDGLARGYLDRPEMTAEKFVPDPFRAVPGARMYRSGDLARYLPDGNLEFLGRIDDQVKIRGFRVEPGEVQAVLQEHPDVRQAAVVARAGATGGRALVAYIVPEGAACVPDPEALRRFLGERMPQAMIPADFATLEALPLTASGKLDRARLPALDPSGPTPGHRVAPRTAAERTLAGIWRAILKIDTVGIDDDFFALGGDSLAAMRLASHVSRATGANLPVRAVFDARTIRAMAEVLASYEDDSESVSSGVVRRHAAE